MSDFNSSENAVLAAKNVSKQVSSPEGTLTILSEVSFSIDKGDSVAIVGASGAGKSTLLALLAGLDLPTSGEIWLDGNNLTRLDEDGRAAVRAASVGFVFQSFHLVPSLNALENVMLPLELSGKAMPRQTARGIMEKVGLGERWSHYPSQLSGGEKQRVAIARAFATEPAVLFADEPTGNLDSENGERILDLIEALSARHGTAVILVTHAESATRICQRIIRFRDGEIESDRPFRPAGQSEPVQP